MSSQRSDDLGVMTQQYFEEDRGQRQSLQQTFTKPISYSTLEFYIQKKPTHEILHTPIADTPSWSAA